MSDDKTHIQVIIKVDGEERVMLDSGDGDSILVKEQAFYRRSYHVGTLCGPELTRIGMKTTIVATRGAQKDEEVSV